MRNEGVQTEEHVLVKCKLTENVRIKYDTNFQTVGEVFNSNNDLIIIVSYNTV